MIRPRQTPALWRQRDRRLIVYAATRAVIVVLMKLFAAPMAQRPRILLNRDVSGRYWPGGKVIRAHVRGKNLAEVGELRLQAFDLEANDSAARERHRHDA